MTEEVEHEQDDEVSQLLTPPADKELRDNAVDKPKRRRRRVDKEDATPLFDLPSAGSVLVRSKTQGDEAIVSVVSDSYSYDGTSDGKSLTHRAIGRWDFS